VTRRQGRFPEHQGRESDVQLKTHDTIRQDLRLSTKMIGEIVNSMNADSVGDD
jgi:hypothetical protein